MDIIGSQIAADSERDDKTYREERYDLFVDISDCVFDLRFVHL